ncbi:MAG: transporter [Bacteroidetes bacterium]|nr:MAG: transporter [Bacteroidota bacterium]
MGSTLLIFVFGAFFGLILQYAGLNRYNTISGQALLKNNTVVKTILVAIGLGAILLSITTGLGLSQFHVKPFITGGLIFGGLIFGAGMAILGYCPGTMAVSLGEGSMDALIGIIGGLFGGLVFTLVLPAIKPVLGPDLGKLSAYTLAGSFSFIYYLMVIVIGLLIIYAAFYIHLKEKSVDKKWIYAGVALALLDVIVFLSATTNRPIGASTSYPWLADAVTGLTNNNYFQKISTPGSWEAIFLLGAMVAAFIGSLIKGDFKLILVHDNWKKYKNNAAGSRAIWAFVGGFILIFGARMAGGCTSGHVISGGIQMAFSSFTFGIFMFMGLIITGKVFFNTKVD